MNAVFGIYDADEEFRLSRTVFYGICNLDDEVFRKTYLGQIDIDILDDAVLDVVQIFHAAYAQLHLIGLVALALYASLDEYGGVCGAHIAAESCPVFSEESQFSCP